MTTYEEKVKDKNYKNEEKVQVLKTQKSHASQKSLKNEKTKTLRKEETKTDKTK